MALTRRQQEIYDYLLSRQDSSAPPPTLDELCQAMGVSSRGSMHKHVQALIDSYLIEPLQGQHRGIRLRSQDDETYPYQLPYLGKIAAGHPLESVANAERIDVPAALSSNKTSFVLRVQGESMIEAGIFDGDYVVVEQCNTARNGDIVVALIDQMETTLKRIEQKPGEVILYPENKAMEPMHFRTEQVKIQGILKGLFRSY